MSHIVFQAKRCCENNLQAAKSLTDLLLQCENEQAFFERFCNYISSAKSPANVAATNNNIQPLH